MKTIFLALFLAGNVSAQTSIVTDFGITKAVGNASYVQKDPYYDGSQAATVSSLTVTGNFSANGTTHSLGTMAAGTTLNVGGALGTDGFANRLTFGITGYTGPGNFNTAATGDKIVLWTSNDSESRLGFSLTDTMYVKSMGTTGTNAFAVHGALANSGAPNRLFTIQKAGNVGIGVATPAAKLDVRTVATTAYTLAVSSANSMISFGVDKYGHVVSSGTVPTLGTCANATISPYSSDRKGTVMFTGANSTCEVVFSVAYTCADEAVICTLQSHDGTGVVNGAELTTHGAAGFSFKPALANYASGDHVHYICEGNP